MSGDQAANPTSMVLKTPCKPDKHLSNEPDGVSRSSSSKRRSFTIPPSPFLKKIGCGTGVSVFLVDRPSTPSGLLKSPWAVKKLNRKPSGGNHSMLEERLLHEAAILKNIKHGNIVGYRDTLRGPDGRICLCMESGERSLADLIDEQRDGSCKPFAPSKIYKVVENVARALSYLHNTHKLLHADLKSHNILVMGDFHQVKLCDFGVCLKLKEDLQGLDCEDDMYVGTGAWSSPEALSDGMVTDKSDIYSLGCVIFEMLALNTPHLPPILCDDNSDSLSLEDSFDEQAFLDAQGTVPVLPDIDYGEDYHPYMALVSICCREDASSRPSASDIVSTLSTLYERGTVG